MISEALQQCKTYTTEMNDLHILFYLCLIVRVKQTGCII